MTDTFPLLVVCIGFLTPMTGTHSPRVVQVSNVADAFSVLLFATTRNSLPFFASIRETAKMPAPSSAYRCTCAPSARAGYSARIAASALRCR